MLTLFAWPECAFGDEQLGPSCECDGVIAVTGIGAIGNDFVFDADSEADGGN